MAGMFPDNLEDVFKQQAQSQSAGITDQYNQARRRLVSQQAASGRLMSGVADYPITDLDTGEASALSGVQRNLANTLAGIPSEDWLNSNEFNRKLSLTDYIGRLMKPSTLDEIFQGIGLAGQVAGPAAALMA